MRRVLMGTLAALACVAVVGVAVARAGAATAGCQVSYLIVNQWSGGFQAQITVVNDGDPVSGWSLGFDFTAGQQVTQGWSATLSQVGAHVTAANPSWSPTLSTGASATFGLIGTWTSTNPPATNFALNATACAWPGGPSGSAAPSASASASPTPSPSISAVSDPIVVTGVVTAGVEIGCLLLVPDYNPQGMPFLLLGGDRTVLVVGAHVRVSGIPQGGASTCMQGTPLKVLSATPVP